MKFQGCVAWLGYVGAHPTAVRTLLLSMQRWLGALLQGLMDQHLHHQAAHARAPLTLGATDAWLLRGCVELLSALVPSLAPENAALLFELALRAHRLLPNALVVDAFTDGTLAAVVRLVAAQPRPPQGGLAALSPAAIDEACRVAGEETRAALAVLLPGACYLAGHSHCCCKPCADGRQAQGGARERESLSRWGGGGAS